MLAARCAVLLAVAAAAVCCAEGAGMAMPSVLLGTGYMSGYIGHNVSDTAYTNVKSWLALGGRGIDTAKMYKCQVGIGAAVRESGIPRSDLFILSKVPGTNGYDTTIADVMFDIRELGVTYLDMVLLHWCGSPTHVGGCSKDTIASSWKALEDLHKNGTLRNIGISNFCPDNLADLMKGATITPQLHQIERHPGFPQKEMVAQCQKLGIPVQGYAPLADPDRCAAGKSLFTEPALTKVAAAHNISAAQTLLAWQTQQGFSVTPRVERFNTTHMKENIAVMGPSFPRLAAADLAALDGLAKSRKCWPVGVCILA